MKTEILIADLEGIAQDFIDSPVDQSMEKLETLAEGTLKLCALVYGWRGNFKLKLDSEEEAGK